MRNKNIAVLATALDSPEQAEIINGITEYGKGHNCNIAVFLWFTGAFEKEKHNQGEINIARLPDLNLFDGVILFANALHLEENERELRKLLATVRCPIVSIGCKFENSICVASDTYTAMRQMVEHFVIDHHMTRIHFVKGVKGNEDAEERFRAYVDVLEDYGIPVVPELISQGDFYITGAEEAAEEILHRGNPLPEAIVCANDTMAITLCDIMMRNGYRVPGDVMISGYDWSVEGRKHTPSITTVRSRFKEIGSIACRVLDEKTSGREVEDRILLPDELVLGESCGCKAAQIYPDYSHAAYLPKTEKLSEVYPRELMHHVIMLEKHINESNQFDEWRNSLKIFIQQINPEEFYFCTNRNFVRDVFEKGAMAQEEMDMEEQLAYSEQASVALAFKNGEFVEKNDFESRYAFDELFAESEEPKLYIFSPMHYLERNFGYVIFVNSDFPMSNVLYVNWLIVMGNSIENIRRQSMLRKAMERLDDMYIHDSLTGAYNRFGMERFYAEVKRKCIMSHIPMMVSFVDLDHLKQINDEYGHEEGDRIISAAAEVLQKCSEKYYVVRYGGDEYVILGTVADEKEADRYWIKVQAAIEAYNKEMNKPARLELSYGYRVFQVDHKTRLEECIRLVDNDMYKNKNRKRGK